jgi:predicted O-methyltransferase YrrM
MALSNPNARIISLESESAYMAQTLNALEECGIENVDIRLSKLINYDSGKWYEAKDLPNADLVVLDGPNRSKANRNIAYDVLNLDSATVIIDDAEDNGLMEQFNNWAESKGRTVVKLGIKQKTAAISLPRKAA